MRLRLIALIGLVLGLSRLAFPATPEIKRGTTTRTKIAQKHRKQKLRPRPVRRAPAPRKHQVTPLIEAPELRLSLVDHSIPMLARLTIRASKPPNPTAKAMRSVRQPLAEKILRTPYWTAERAAADAHFAADSQIKRDSRFAAAPTHLVAMGDPRLAYDQQRAFTLRLTIRL